MITTQTEEDQMELLPPNFEDHKQINEKGGSIKRSLDIQAIEYSIKHPIKAINSYISKGQMTPWPFIRAALMSLQESKTDGTWLMSSREK
jgi:DNA-directed RNA polymerase subunit L